MAERICATVREIDPGVPGLRVSMSIGVASFPESSRDTDGVLRRGRRRPAARQGARPQPRLSLRRGSAGPRLLDGHLVTLGRALRAPTIGLSDEETAALITALAVFELSGYRRRRRSCARTGAPAPRRAGENAAPHVAGRAPRSPTTRCSTPTSAGTAADTRKACAASASRAWRALSPSVAATSPAAIAQPARKAEHELDLRGAALSAMRERPAPASSTRASRGQRFVAAHGSREERGRPAAPRALRRRSSPR